MQDKADLEAEEKRKVDLQQHKVDLQHRLFHVKEYMALVASLKTGQYKFDIKELQNNMSAKEKKSKQSELREALKKEPIFNKLNNGTLNAIIDFATLIPSDNPMEAANFETDKSIETWLNNIPDHNILELETLNESLIKLEKKEKTAHRLKKASETFYITAQALKPLAQIPILNIVMAPIITGLLGFCLVFGAVSVRYNPALGGKIEPIKSTLHKAVYLSGGIATASIALSLCVPPLAPILLPIAAIGLLINNALWATSAALEFYHEIKEGKKKEGKPDAGHHWRIAGKGATVLQIAGNVVVAALIIAALFTPVGWAAGAAAAAFAIGAAAATVAVFGVSQFCHWRARKKIQANTVNNTKQTQQRNDSPRPSVNLTKSKHLDPQETDTQQEKDTEQTQQRDISLIPSVTVPESRHPQKTEDQKTEVEVQKPAVNAKETTLEHPLSGHPFIMFFPMDPKTKEPKPLLNSTPPQEAEKPEETQKKQPPRPSKPPSEPSPHP